MKLSAILLALPLIGLGLTGCLGAPESADDAPDEGSVAEPSLFHVVPTMDLLGPSTRATTVTQTQPTGAKLVDHGGSVLTNVKVIPVYWNTSVAYQTEMSAFYAAIPGSDYFDLLAQYDGIGHGTRGTPYVSSQSGASGTTLTETAIASALYTMFSTGKLATPVAGNYYPIHLPAGVNVTNASGSNQSCVQYCAYHNYFTYGGVKVAYGVMIDPATCSSGCGDGIDDLTTVSSHELVEAVTDPYLNAWYDGTNGEISDICAWQQATVLGSDGASYVVQRQFSNLDDNCVWWSEPNKLTSQVLIYSESNYVGDVQALYPGSYSTYSALTIGNDALSSLRIPSGWTVTLYSDNNFSGSSLTLTSDASSLTAQSFDNTVSSIKVTGPSASFPVIYKDGSYSGSSQTLRPGVYNTSGDLTIGNDAVSSVSVPSGWSVTLYKDHYYSGSSVTYTSSASSLGSFNDDTTSIKVTGPSAYQTPVVIYKDANYTGQGQALWPGHYASSNLTIGDDALSSLTIPSGWTVYLLNTSPYGTMKVYTSNQSSLTNDGFNDVTSEIVVVGPS